MPSVNKKVLFEFALDWTVGNLQSCNTYKTLRHAFKPVYEVDRLM